MKIAIYILICKFLAIGSYSAELRKDIDFIFCNSLSLLCLKRLNVPKFLKIINLNWIFLIW